ncbi:MAG: CoA pyrophosphatase [Halioglobus sp.]|nr:CoA pyrophosphatase [Halioglobus sp.]
MNGRPRGILQRLDNGLPLEESPWRERFGHSELPEAAVLVALTDEAEPRVLLGRRALHLPLHPGELAFAGGKREAEDDSPWKTALREAEEEVGMPPQFVGAIGEMEPLITRTGFKVYPCVGSIPAAMDLRVDPAEFDSVLTPPLAVFADRGIFRLKAMSVGSRTRLVPHYQVGGETVWGVTATILALLANVAYDAGLDTQ